ncbi:MAG: insulinase family protein [Caulobacteraceae bacterium]
MRTLRKNGVAVRRPIAVALAGCLALLTTQAQTTQAQTTQAQAGAGALAQPDPDVIFGRLPNGLTYAVKQVSANEGASLVLYIKAGAFDEEPNERGLAHFIEHMAFRGTTHFPAGTLFPQLAQQGIAAGRDQNGGTALYGTQYFIDLPKATDAGLELSATWLRDVADGLTLKAEDVDGERGVVQSEVAERHNIALTEAEASARFFAPDLRGAGRSPGGSTEVIKTAGPAQLRAFYQRWYRPENAIVVVTGNRPAKELKALVEKRFSSWTNRTAAPSRAQPGGFDFNRQTDVQVLVDPQAQTTVQVCRFTRARPHMPEGLDSWGVRMANEAWAFALRQRLSRATEGASAPFTRASVAQGVQVYYQLDEACVSAQPAAGWNKALAEISRQLRSLDAFGVTETEYAQFQLGIINRVSSTVDSAGKRPPHDITNTILQNLISGDTFDTPEEDRRMELTALSQLTRDKVNAAFRARWSSAAQPLIFVTTPTAIERDSVMSAWRDLQTATLEPVVPSARDWPYALASAPGKVVKRDVIENPGFVRLTFANGLVVNFKQSALAKDRYVAIARFGDGLRALPPEDRFKATLGAAALAAGGLGKLSAEDVTDYCRRHGCGVVCTTAPSSYSLLGASRPGDLQLELQVMAAFLTDPGFRPELNARVPTLAETYVRSLTLDPVRMADQARLEAAMPDAAPPSREVLSHYTATDFDRILRPVLTREPIELTLFGDLTEAEAIRALSNTLGALPPRTGAGPARPAPERLSYEKVKAAHVQAYHVGAKDRAALLLTWPLFTSTVDSVREQHVLALLAGVFQNAAFDEMREKLGKTYSPSVALAFPEGDQGSLSVVVQSAPGDVGLVEDGAAKIAARLAAGEITDKDLDRVRIPIVSKATGRRDNEAWWLAAMNGSAHDGKALKNLLTYDEDMRTITLDEVKTAARRWLAAQPIVARAVPQATASAADPAK